MRVQGEIRQAMRWSLLGGRYSLLPTYRLLGTNTPVHITVLAFYHMTFSNFAGTKCPLLTLNTGLYPVTSWVKGTSVNRVQQEV